MTTEQAIKQNLHYAKLQLVRTIRVKPTDPIEAMHIASTIKHYTNEVEQMNTQLKNLINN
jgi:hypothetical protein